jgi:hypothetical protein
MECKQMIVRLSQKMAKKIKRSPTGSCPQVSNPYVDWSAHLFTAGRVQYIILTNTFSLYSMVLYARGITDSARFIERTFNYMAEYTIADGYEFQFRRLIVPEAGSVTFIKLNDRRIVGSINELIRLAKWDLSEEQLSPFETSQRINQAPMSYLDYDNPKDAFAKMKPATEPQETG